MTTKLQRKRMRRRVLQGARQYQVTACGWADRAHARWFEERGTFGRSAYHHKRPAWLYCIAARGGRAQSVKRLLARLANIRTPMQWATLAAPSLTDIIVTCGARA